MTEEDIIQEGRIAGIGFFDIFGWTWGEVIDYITVTQERIRRHNQDLSIISYVAANYMLGQLGGSNERLTIEEMFPYWTQEEQDEIRYDRLYSSLNNREA